MQRLNRPDRVRIYTSASGERIIGLISPIENEPSCYNADCHAHPASQSVLGVLDVTMSLAKVDETIAAGQRTMMADVVLGGVVISIIFGGLIWMMVYRPVKKLTVGTHHVAEGDLDFKIDVSSRDEMGELASSFNQMTLELKRANEEITDWTKTLESRVEQKTAELQRAHQRMIQIERMASMGQLAAIVAHEINNPLAGILTYARLLMKRMASNDLRPEVCQDMREDLDIIASESARCGEIVKGLLQFARQGNRNYQPTDVNKLITESLRLVKHKTHLLGVETTTVLEENMPQVACDGQEIKQALVAILINACEAVASEGGQIEAGSRYLPDSDAVEIWIRDNGVGMDQETLQHIFEPFFTTKEQGKGVGLGLAAVSGIVSQHSGDITVQSTQGEGTTVNIRLPVSAATVQAAEKKATAL